MSRTQSSRSVCLVDDATGVGHGFCSTSCLVSWVRWFHGSFEEQSLAFPKLRLACRYCYICGRRCGETQHDCILHEACPERDWTHTYSASVIAPLLVAELDRDLTRGDLDVLYDCYLEREKQESPESIAARAAGRIRNPTDEPPEAK